MARYTELLSEYLENGGRLPAVFSQIAGFDTLFKLKYADCEIGFETAALFELKLSGLAELKIPAYAARISRVEALEELVLTGNKTHTKTGAIKRNYGARTNTRADLPSIPYNATDENSYTPTSIDKGEGYTDAENYDNVTDTDTGLTAGEVAEQLKALESDVKIIKEECLQEFAILFMQIY